MKKLYAAIIISAVCILVLPWGYFIFESNTTEFLLFLAFIIYPISSIALGALASGDLKRMRRAVRVRSRICGSSSLKNSGLSVRRPAKAMSG